MNRHKNLELTGFIALLILEIILTPVLAGPCGTTQDPCDGDWEEFDYMNQAANMAVIPPAELDLAKVESAGRTKELTSTQIKERLEEIDDLGRLNEKFRATALKVKYGVASLEIPEGAPAVKMDKDGFLRSEKSAIKVSDYPGAAFRVLKNGEIKIDVANSDKEKFEKTLSKKFGVDKIDLPKDSQETMINPEGVLHTKTGSALKLEDYPGAQIGIGEDGSINVKLKPNSEIKTPTLQPLEGQNPKVTVEGKEMILPGFGQGEMTGKAIFDENGMMISPNTEIKKPGKYPIIFKSTEPIRYVMEGSPGKIKPDENYAIYKEDGSIEYGGKFSAERFDQERSLKIPIRYSPNGGKVEIKPGISDKPEEITISGKASVTNGKWVLDSDGKRLIAKPIESGPALLKYSGLAKDMNLNVNLDDGRKASHSIVNSDFGSILKSNDQQEYYKGLDGKLSFVVNPNTRNLWAFKGDTPVYYDPTIIVGPAEARPDGTKHRYTPSPTGEFRLGEQIKGYTTNSWENSQIPHGSRIKFGEEGNNPGAKDYYFLRPGRKDKQDNWERITNLDAGMRRTEFQNKYTDTTTGETKITPINQYVSNPFGEVAARIKGGYLLHDYSYRRPEPDKPLEHPDITYSGKESHGCVNTNLAECTKLVGDVSGARIMIAPYGEQDKDFEKRVKRYITGFKGFKTEETTSETKPATTPAIAQKPTVTKPAEPTRIAQTPDRGTNSQRYVNVANLNIRSGTSTNTKKIGMLTRGTPLQIVSSNGDWSEIEYNGQRSYVASRYLSSSEMPSFTVAQQSIDAIRTESTATARTSSGSNINVRSGPSANVIGSLGSGQKIRVIGICNQWCKIQYGNGQEGYISRNYVTT